MISTKDKDLSWIFLGQSNARRYSTHGKAITPHRKQSHNASLIKTPLFNFMKVFSDFYINTPNLCHILFILMKS